MKREIVHLLENMSAESIKVFITRQSHEQMDYLQLVLEHTSSLTQEKWNTAIATTMSYR